MCVYKEFKKKRPNLLNFKKLHLINNLKKEVGQKTYGFGGVFKKKTFWRKKMNTILVFEGTPIRVGKQPGDSFYFYFGDFYKAIGGKADIDPRLRKRIVDQDYYSNWGSCKIQKDIQHYFEGRTKVIFPSDMRAITKARSVGYINGGVNKVFRPWLKNALKYLASLPNDYKYI